MSATSSDSGANEVLLQMDFETKDCNDAPLFVLATPDCATVGFDVSPGCYQDDLELDSSLAGDTTVVRHGFACVANLTEYIDETYGAQTYVRIDNYNSTGCMDWVSTNVYLADGLCHSMLQVSSETNETFIESYRTIVSADGGISLNNYNSANCNEHWEYSATSYSSENIENLRLCQFTEVVTTNAIPRKNGNEEGSDHTGSSDGGSSSSAASSTVFQWNVQATAALALLASNLIF